MLRPLRKLGSRVILEAWLASIPREQGVAVTKGEACEPPPVLCKEGGIHHVDASAAVETVSSKCPGSCMSRVQARASFSERTFGYHAAEVLLLDSLMDAAGKRRRKAASSFYPRLPSISWEL